MSDFVEQLNQLSELHARGSLSNAEFETAKARLLGGVSTPTDTSILALQNDLAALDRQWNIEREKYKVAGRYNSSIPEPGDGAKAGLAITIFGVFWTLGATAMAIGATTQGVPAPMALFFWFFPIFGVFFIVSGLNKGREMTSKTEAYKRAEAEYQSKRAVLESRIRALS